MYINNIVRMIVMSARVYVGYSAASILLPYNTQLEILCDHSRDFLYTSQGFS